MTQLQITLPDETSRFIDQQLASGHYESRSDFVLELIEKARLAAAKERLTELILEGENSGEGVEFTKEWWETRMAELWAEAERRRSA